MRKISLGFALLSTIFLNMSISYAGPTGCNVTIDGYGLCKQDINDYNGVSAPAVSNVGQGRIYFDNILNKFQCSENGNAYVNCVGGGSGGSGITFTDGSHTVSSATQLSVTGGTIGGTSPNATLIIPGGGNVGIGTANDITYWGASNTLQASNSFTFNGANVGIGPTSPDTKLTISGPNVNMDLINTGTGNRVAYLGSDSGSFPDYGSLYLYGAGNPLIKLVGELPAITIENPSSSTNNVSYMGIYSGADTSEGNLQLYESAVSKVNISGNHGALFNSGNVGIGTANANQPLTVAGRIYSTTGGIQFPDNTVQTTAATGGGGTVTAVSVASTNGFTGTSSGGATPALTLATSITGLLKGNGTAISAASSGTDYAPATSGSSILYGNGSGGFSNVSIGTSMLFSGGTLSSTASGSSQWTTTNTNDVYLPSNGNVGIGTNLTTTAALTVMNGNVGIGTWVPGATLDVEGTLNTNNIFNYGAGNVGIGTVTTKALVTLGITGQSVITSTGNVGIGTSVPNTALDIGQGTLQIEEVSNSAKHYSISSSVIGSPNTDDRLVINSTGTSNGTRVWIDTNGTTAGLSMAQGGNEELFFGAQSGAGYAVYYGTFTLRNTNANSGFSVTQGPPALILLNSTTTSSVAKNVLDVNGAAVIGGSYASTNTAPSNGLLVQGNEGVGTISPGQALDVQGTIRVSKLGSTIAVVSGTNGCQGQGTLVSGTVTISTTCTPATSQGIFLQDATTGTLVNIGVPTVGTVTSATSFVINSSNALDTSNVNWWILKSS